MREDKPKQGPLRIVLWCVYDLLWIVLAGLIYGVGVIAAAALVMGVYQLGGWIPACLVALPAYCLMLLVVILEMSLIRLVSPRVQPGIFKKFSKGNFVALVWLTGLNNVLFAMPFMRTVNFIAALRFLYYRGQGMHTHFGNWISVDAVIMDPWLVTLGRNVNIGGMAAITCHVALQEAMVIMPVTIGNDVVVGAASKIGPGVEIGDGAVIGADAGLGLKVKVGEGAYVEPFSRVEAYTKIGPYEKWAGSPAVKIGDRPRPRPPHVPAPETPEHKENADVPGS